MNSVMKIGIIGDSEERYNCSFGLKKEFQKQLEQNGLKVAGTDEEGEARIMLIEKNRFYIATLFQPQLSSTIDNPHPMIMTFIKSVKDYHYAEHNRSEKDKYTSK